MVLPNDGRGSGGAGTRSRTALGRSARPQKIAMLVAQRIVGEITDRRLEPGAPLLPEREMLEEYGVSRGTLREALRYLEMQGVLTIRTGPSGGPIVSRISSKPLASVLALILQLSRTQFRDVLEARRVIEPAIAARAAERIDDESLDELAESLQRMRVMMGDHPAFLAENETFHRVIARAAHNEVLALFIASLNWITDASALGVIYTEPAQKVVIKAHEKILRALRARDRTRAEAAMAEHMAGFAAYLDARYPAILDTPLRWDQGKW